MKEKELNGLSGESHGELKRNKQISQRGLSVSRRSVGMCVKTIKHLLQDAIA